MDRIWFYSHRASHAYKLSRPIRCKVSDLARQPGSAARSTIATLEMLTLVSSADMINKKIVFELKIEFCLNFQRFDYDGQAKISN